MKPNDAGLTSCLPIAAIFSNFKKAFRGTALAKTLAIEIQPGSKPVLARKLSDSDMEVLSTRNWARLVTEDRQAISAELDVLRAFFAKSQFPVSVSYQSAYRWVSDEDGYKSKILKFEFFIKIDIAWQELGFEKIQQDLSQPIIEGH